MLYFLLNLLILKHAATDFNKSKFNDLKGIIEPYIPRLYRIKCTNNVQIEKNTDQINFQSAFLCNIFSVRGEREYSINIFGLDYMNIKTQREYIFYQFPHFLLGCPIMRSIDYMNIK